MGLRAAEGDAAGGAARLSCPDVDDLRWHAWRIQREVALGIAGGMTVTPCMGMSAFADPHERGLRGHATESYRPSNRHAPIPRPRVRSPVDSN